MEIGGRSGLYIRDSEEWPVKGRVKQDSKSDIQILPQEDR